MKNTPERRRTTEKKRENDEVNEAGPLEAGHILQKSVLGD